MSWVVYVQNLPHDPKTIADIPADFTPEAIGSRDAVIAALQDVWPAADFTDPQWGKIDGPTFSIAVNLGTEDPISFIGLHVRGSGDEAPLLIAAIVDRLGMRGLDGESASGFFEPSTAAASFASWCIYRDQVLAAQAEKP